MKAVKLVSSSNGRKKPAWRSPPTRAPDDWTKTFTDPHLCAAIVDRLIFGGNIIEVGADSYRLSQTRARAAQQGEA